MTRAHTLEHTWNWCISSRVARTAHAKLSRLFYEPHSRGGKAFKFHAAQLLAEINTRNSPSCTNSQVRTQKTCIETCFGQMLRHAIAMSGPCSWSSSSLPKTASLSCKRIISSKAWKHSTAQESHQKNLAQCTALHSILCDWFATVHDSCRILHVWSTPFQARP